jgi:lipoyl(octanoyl) transferase
VQDLKKTTESKSTNNLIKFDSHYLGLMNYEAALQKQYDFHQLAVTENKATVLGLEHPAVLTLGYRADSGHNLVAHSIPTVKIERGGLATIHSEGQLVIYPILNLKKQGIGVREYVTVLINTTKQLLQENGIESSCSTDSVAGLFTKNGKIAFCGIQVKNGASLHGLSLNVHNDLKLFDGIISCGVSRQKMDSMKNHGVNPGLEVLFNRWIEIFNYNMLNRQEHLPRC